MESLLVLKNNRFYVWALSFLPSHSNDYDAKDAGIEGTAIARFSLQPLLRRYFLINVALIFWVILFLGFNFLLRSVCLTEFQPYCPNILISSVSHGEEAARFFSQYHHLHVDEILQKFPFHIKHLPSSQVIYPQNPFHSGNTSAPVTASSARRQRWYGFLKRVLIAVVQAPIILQKKITSANKIIYSFPRSISRRIKSSFWKKKPTDYENATMTVEVSYSGEVALNAKSEIAYFAEKVNDHMEENMDRFDLSVEQRTRLFATYYTLQAELTPELKESAAVSGMRITPYLVYQYLASADWDDNYNGLSFVDAIKLTINWKYESFQKYYRRANFTDIQRLIAGKLCYISHVADQRSRVILYFKIKNNRKRESAELYTKMIVYMMDKAIEQSIVHKSGEFVAVIDFNGFSFSTIPPLSFTKEAIMMLMRHYPHRVGDIYLVNVGHTFSFVWNMVQHMIPKKVTNKMIVLSSHDVKQPDNIMVQRLGKQYLEQEYGGLLVSSYSDEDYGFESNE